MLYLLFLAAAHAGQVTGAELEALFEQILPRLESAAGRAFVAQPELEVVRREDYVHTLRRQIREEMQLRDAPDAVIDDLIERRMELDPQGFRSVLALFNPWDDRVYVLSDSIEDLFAFDSDLPDALLLPVLECVLAHELAHGLQHEAGLFSDSFFSTMEASKAMLEGHAEWASGQVCAPAAAGYLGLIQGSDRIWPLQEETIIQQYTIAPLYLDAVAGSAAAVWAKLKEPADFTDVLAPFEAISADLAAQSLALAAAAEASFPEVSPFEELMEVLHSRPSDSTLSPSAASTIFGVAGEDSLALATRMTAVHSTMVPTGELGDLEVTVVRFSDAAAAAELVELGRRRWRGRTHRSGAVTFRYDKGRRADEADKERYYWRASGAYLASICLDGASLPPQTIYRLLSAWDPGAPLSGPM